ncbi:MAG: protein kinase family protein, partial [Ardenticatenaceae bacterium]
AAFTPNYASLEQIEGQGTNERSDLYSLGVTLHHLLTGALPPTAVTRASAQVYANPDPLRPANELNPQVPAALATLLTQATALKHTQRPGSASTMRAMLKAAAPAVRKEVPLYDPETPVFTFSPNTPPPPAKPRTAAPAPPTEKLSTAPVVFKAHKEIYKEDTGGCFKLKYASFLVFFLTCGILNGIIQFDAKQNIPIAIMALILAIALAYASLFEEKEKKYKYFNKHAFFLKNKKIAISKNNIRIYDPVTLKEEKKLFNASLSEIDSMAVSPDGVTLASASRKTIQLWDVVSGVLRSTLKGSFATVKSLAFSPDGATVASAFDDKTIKLWDIDSGTVRTTLAGHLAAVNSVAFSPDGATLASASDDKTIKLWNVARKRLRTTLFEHSEAINSIAFSPDGTWLASASDDKSIKLWHMPSGTLRTTLCGHTQRVNCVTFSPNGKLLASASDDNTARLWDVASGTLRANLLDHTKEVTSVTFSPDGQTLASSSKDKSVRLWDLSPLG